MDVINTRRQAGVSLIEALIAIVVLSVGLLGIAGLHTLSMRTGTAAMNRTKAVALGQDLLERMLANRQAITNYDWGDIASVSTPVTTITDNCFDATATGFNSGCTPEEIATNDRAHWQALLQHRDFGLPGASASVDVTADNGSLYDVTIVVNWSDGIDDDRYTLNATVNKDI